MTAFEHGSGLVIGLTGGIGSGKSTVARGFETRGAATLDTDRIAHALCAPAGVAIPAIRTQFGAAYLTPDGALDRAKMRERIFSDSASKKQLEAILHPLIRLETLRQAGEAAGDYLIVMVPLLLESGDWKARFSRVLVVDCPVQLQIERVRQRNGLSEQQIRAILATQALPAVRLAAADDVIVNATTSAALDGQIEHLHRFYCQLARQSQVNEPRS